MSGKEQSSSKKKDKQFSFKKAVISLLFGFLIILMVFSLVPNKGAMESDSDLMNDYKIAKVNGTTYVYTETSVFAYLYNQIKENLSAQYEGMVSADIIADAAYNNSVDMLVDYAVMNDFAEKIGLDIPSQTVKSSLTSLGVSGVPSEGLVKYLSFLYAERSLANSYGDIMNAVSSVNYGELYSYYELVDLAAQADILYLDITNYLKDTISDEAAEIYYEENISEFATKIYIEDLTVTNKPLARELAFSIISNGWDKTVLKYKDKITLSSVVASNSGETEDRFDLAISMIGGAVISNGVYEKKAYHLVNITEYPSLSEVTNVIKEYVMLKYVEENYDELYNQYQDEMQALVDNAVVLAVDSGDIERIAAQSGMDYVKTGYFTPINLLLPDEDGEELELPILENADIMEFVFTEDLGSVSDLFSTDGYYIILQIVYRGENPTIDEDTIAQEIGQRYYYFKNGTFSYYGQRLTDGAVYGDWFGTELSNAEYVVYTDDETNE